MKELFKTIFLGLCIVILLGVCALWVLSDGMDYIEDVLTGRAKQTEEEKQVRSVGLKSFDKTNLSWAVFSIDGKDVLFDIRIQQ